MLSKEADTIYGLAPSLCLSNEALPYLLIPPRLLEVVEHPQKLHLVIYTEQSSVVDWGIFHPELGSNHKKGLLEICLRSYSNQEGKHVLVIANYKTIPELQRQHIAKSFNMRLREVARAMGFWVIVGDNNAINIEVFRNKLGRTPLTLVNPVFIEAFFPFGGMFEPSPYTTIDFLKPQDKEKYCR